MASILDRVPLHVNRGEFLKVCFKDTSDCKINQCLCGKGGDLEKLLPQYEACIFMFGVVILGLSFVRGLLGFSERQIWGHSCL